MTVLVANIGTSDLAIKVEDGKYAEKYSNLFLPIGLDRNEPNLVNDSGFEDIWADARSFPREYAFEKFGIEQRQYAFRDFTEKLWKSYEQDNDDWQQRIHPGRIWSVIEKAIEFDVKSIYIFITDQPERNDTIFLFNILKKWFKNEWQLRGKKNVEIEAVLVPKDIAAIDQNRLLETYYSFFNTIDRNEDLLISIKGGTYQMQTALRVQAMSSDNRLLFLDPQLSVKQVLEGEPSDCIVTSYWRYLRTQKYQSVKLLLNKRWDFHGAKVLLEEWQNALVFLQEYLQEEDKEQLELEQQKLDSVISLLKEAADHLNFVSVKKSNDPLHSLLNLYTQCRIYWGLEEIANVLPRLGSFYEEALQVIIRYLGQDRWFRGNNKNEDWTLIRSQNSERTPSNIVDEYHRIENSFGERIKWSDTKRSGEQKFKLGNRYRKRNFAEALIERRGNHNQKNSWVQIISDLKKIDFWVDKRNDLIHGTKGLTLETMEQEYEKYKNSYTEQDKKNNYKPSIPCHYKNILGHITSICEQLIQLTEQESNHYIGYKEDTPYYLYSNFRDRVIKQLDEN